MSNLTCKYYQFNKMKTLIISFTLLFAALYSHAANVAFSTNEFLVLLITNFLCRCLSKQTKKFIVYQLILFTIPLTFPCRTLMIISLTAFNRISFFPTRFQTKKNSARRSKMMCKEDSSGVFRTTCQHLPALFFPLILSLSTRFSTRKKSELIT